MSALFTRFQGANHIVHTQNSCPTQGGELEDHAWIHPTQIPGHDVVVLQNREDHVEQVMGDAIGAQPHV